MLTQRAVALARGSADDTLARGQRALQAGAKPARRAGPNGRGAALLRGAGACDQREVGQRRIEGVIPSATSATCTASKAAPRQQTGMGYDAALAIPSRDRQPQR